MLITENIILNGKEFRHNYSDAGFYIVRNDGVKYSDAIDILEAEYTYSETDEEIEGWQGLENLLADGMSDSSDDGEQ